MDLCVEFASIVFGGRKILVSIGGASGWWWPEAWSRAAFAASDVGWGAWISRQ